MEPVSILGIVGSTAQLIDFAAKLFSATQSIRQSGSLVEHHHLLRASEHLNRLAASIQSDLQCSRPALDDNGREAYELCTKCLQLTKEIETALKGVELHGSHRTWRTFRHVLKSVLGSKKIEDLRQRLDMYTQQLNTRLHLRTQVTLYDTHSKVVESIGVASLESMKAHDETKEQLRQLQIDGEQRELRLRQELVVLRQGLENCIKETANGASRVEQGRLANVTNAIYKLWAEKEAALESVMAYLASLSNGATNQGLSPGGDLNRSTDADMDTVGSRNKPSESAHTSSAVEIATQKLPEIMPSKRKPDRSTRSQAKALSQSQKWPGTAIGRYSDIAIQTSLLMLRDTVPLSSLDEDFHIDLPKVEETDGSVKKKRAKWPSGDYL